MAEINDLNITDASNTTRWPENMAPSAVNNAGRADEGLLARWHKDTNASVVTTGLVNVYAVAANQTISAYYDGLVIAFDATLANTLSATLNVDAVGAATIKKFNDQDLRAGDIEAGQKVWVVYDGTNWQMISPTARSRTPITTRGDVVRGDASGDPERLALGTVNHLIGSDGTDAVYSGGTVAKTTAYPVVLGDHRKTIRADATTAAFTVTLPTVAVAGDGFEITITKTDASVNIVTVDGNGVETIDAPGGNRASVTLPSQFDRLKLVCDGTKWVAIEHRLTFESTEQTVTSAGTLTIPHGLGVRPDNNQIWLVCQTLEFGYSAGDRVPYRFQGADSSDARGIAMVPDATNLNVKFGSLTGLLLAVRFDTGAQIGLTNANWNAVFKCWL